MINTQLVADEVVFDLGKDEIGKVGLDAKMARWEGHIHEVLMPKLEGIVSERDKVYEDIAEGTKLTNFIENHLKTCEEDSTLETMIDLGHHFYATAELPNTGRIFVNIGLGIYVHYTYPEALAYLKQREARLEQRVEALTKQASRIKVEMKIIYEAIAEFSQQQ